VRLACEFSRYEGQRRQFPLSTEGVFDPFRSYVTVGFRALELHTITAQSDSTSVPSE